MLLTKAVPLVVPVEGTELCQVHVHSQANEEWLVIRQLSFDTVAVLFVVHSLELAHVQSVVQRLDCDSVLDGGSLEELRESGPLDVLRGASGPRRLHRSRDWRPRLIIHHSHSVLQVGLGGLLDRDATIECLLVHLLIN